MDDFDCGSYPEPTYSLPEPVIIHPEKMYEIRLETISNLHCLVQKWIWKSEDKLDEELLIKFHRHPSDKIQMRGIVSGLHFNRI